MSQINDLYNDCDNELIYLGLWGLGEKGRSGNGSTFPEKIRGVSERRQL